MPKKKTNESNDDRKQVTQSFSEGKIKTTIKASKDDEGKPWGVFAQTENVHTKDFSKHHKGVWIPANAFQRWFNKFKRIISNIFENFYGEKLIFSEDDIEKEKKKIETLQDELEQQRTRYKEMEQVYLRQQEKVKLAEETKEELSHYETILNKFIEDVDKSIKDNQNIENNVRNDLKNNRWILGLDCEIKATNKDVDPKSEIDLHIISELGEEKVFEIKSPNKKLFVDKKDTYLRISPELSEAISQIVNYLRKTDIYSQINEQGNYKVYKGKGIILMDKNLNQEEQKFNKDYFGLRLDGLNSISFTSLCYQYKIYQKKQGLRQEHKINLPIGIPEIFSMLQKGDYSLEVYSELNSLQKEQKTLVDSNRKIQGLLFALSDKLNHSRE